MTVTASVPQSGSYAESVSYESLGATGAMDDLRAFSLDTRLQLIMQITAWQKAYGNLYATPADVYPAQYSASMEKLLPTDAVVNTLLSSGKLPAYMLSTDMPNYAGLTAAQKALFGPVQQSLLKTSFVTSLLADTAAKPCPVTSTTAPLDCAPANTMRAAWLKNDLRTWVPTAPMLMCGGNADPEVGFYNARLTQAHFAQAHSGTGTAATGVNVPVLDVDSPIAVNDAYAREKAVFALAKQTVINAGQDPASADAYHGGSVFLACGVAAKNFFDKF